MGSSLARTRYRSWRTIRNPMWNQGPFGSSKVRYLPRK
jgi:hypothetical protein